MYAEAKHRLSQLEGLRHNHSLWVLARYPDGRVEEMSVSDMIDLDLDLVRVISGDSLRDLDQILDYQAQKAYEDYPENVT